MGNMAPGPSVAPEIRAILKDSTVAFLSLNYSAAYFDNLNLRLCPIVERYSAWTAYLDEINAEWVRAKGPRFLIFNGTTMGCHPWAETPAMWAEVFRNYETRLLTAGNLLLERRREPRFKRFEAVESAPMPMPGEVDLPPAEEAAFGSLTCRMTGAGSLRKLLFCMREMTMAVDTADGRRKEYRSVTDALIAPVMGAWLLGSLPEFAAVLEPDPAPRFRVRKLVFRRPRRSLLPIHL